MWWPEIEWPNHPIHTLQMASLTYWAKTTAVFWAYVGKPTLYAMLYRFTCFQTCWTFWTLNKALPLCPLSAKVMTQRRFLSNASVSNAQQSINLQCSEHSFGGSIHTWILDGTTSRHRHRDWAVHYQITRTQLWPSNVKTPLTCVNLTTLSVHPNFLYSWMNNSIISQELG